MTIQLPDDDEMIKVWTWVFAFGFVMNYILTRYSYCHMDIPLCRPPVPIKSGPGLAYGMGKPTGSIKGKSSKQLLVPVKCENIPLMELNKPTTSSTEFGSALTIVSILFIVGRFVRSKIIGSPHSPDPYDGAFLLLGIIGIINWSGALGRGPANGPMIMISSIIGLLLLSSVLYTVSNQTTEPLYKYLAIGFMIIVCLVFLFNIKNIYAGFIGSAVANMTTLAVVLAHIVAIADIIRIIVTTDEDTITLHSTVVGLLLLIQLAVYLYNIYKCYRISYTCVPDTSYIKEKGKFFATIGCRAKF